MVKRKKHGKPVAGIGTATGAVAAAGDENRAAGELVVGQEKPTDANGDAAAPAELLGGNDGRQSHAEPPAPPAAGESGPAQPTTAQETAEGLTPPTSTVATEEAPEFERTAAEADALLSDHFDKAIELMRRDTVVMAAVAAGSMIYAGLSPDNGPEYAVAQWCGPTEAYERVAECAAAFLRQWPDGTPEAIVIHLQRAGFKDVPQPGRRELAAWKVFAVTLAELDAIDRAEAAERKAAEWASTPQQMGFGGEQTFKTQPGPFEPSGFTPGR